MKVTPSFEAPPPPPKPLLKEITLTLTPAEADWLIRYKDGGTSKELRRKLIVILEEAGVRFSSTDLAGLWPNGRNK